MIGGVIAFAFFATLPVLLVWLIADGLRTGVVRGRGGPIARTDYPIGYWLILVAYVVPLIISVYFLWTAAQDAWRNGWN